MLWDATPDALRDYVADPARGSRHNRGCAVDVDLFDRRSGALVPMPSSFDEFTPRAHVGYPGGTSLQRWNAALLRRVMAEAGFAGLDEEWWHFDFGDWREYRSLNVPID